MINLFAFFYYTLHVFRLTECVNDGMLFTLRDVCNYIIDIYLFHENAQVSIGCSCQEELFLLWFEQRLQMRP